MTFLRAAEQRWGDSKRTSHCPLFRLPGGKAHTSAPAQVQDSHGGAGRGKTSTRLNLAVPLTDRVAESKPLRLSFLLSTMGTKTPVLQHC